MVFKNLMQSCSFKSVGCWCLALDVMWQRFRYLQMPYLENPHFDLTKLSFGLFRGCSKSKSNMELLDVFSSISGCRPYEKVGSSSSYKVHSILMEPFVSKLHFLMVYFGKLPPVSHQAISVRDAVKQCLPDTCCHPRWPVHQISCSPNNSRL